MVSRNLRENIPTNMIALWDGSITPPSGFILETTLFDTYPKQVPDSCTNPGSSVGSHCHTMSTAGGSHTHTFTDSHTHSISLGGSTCSGSTGPCSGSGSGSCKNHSHTLTCVVAQTVDPTSSITNTSDSHSHSATNLEPPFKEIAHIKYTRSVGLRQKHLSIDTSLLWNDTNSSIPTEYTFNSCYQTKYLKGITNACTTPGNTGGTNTHCHGSGGSHSHVTCIPAHSHTVTGSLTAATLPISISCQVSSVDNVASTHTHSTCNPLPTCGTAVTSTGTNSHSHSTETHDPLHGESSIMKLNTISLRQPSIPVGAVLEWVCTLASIPINYRVSDGSCGTVNLFDRYIKFVDNICTTPGTLAGSSTHQHTSSDHSHSASHDHTSVNSGSSGAQLKDTCFSASNVKGVHTHTLNPGSFTYSFLTASSHQHTTTCNTPASIEVAFIQRL